MSLCSLLPQFLRVKMRTKFLAAVAAWAVSAVLPVVISEPITPHGIFPRQAANINLATLAPALSSQTKIYLPGTAEFVSLSVRWSNLEVPTPNVVIVPGTEKDVVEIVRFATQFFGAGENEVECFVVTVTSLTVL